MGRRGLGMRENCGASDLFESLVYPSLQAAAIEVFRPSALIFALILDDLVCRVPDGGSIVRFNGLFFHHS